jgi:hypothetical protein
VLPCIYFHEGFFLNWYQEMYNFFFLKILVVLGRRTLWHSQMFLQYIKWIIPEFTPSFFLNLGKYIGQKFDTIIKSTNGVI